MNEDEQLLKALQNGEISAFRAIVERHRRRVINICYRFVHDRDEAEDLAQETFLEVHRSIDRFRGKSSFTTWIHRIAVTKSLDCVRRHNRAKRGGKLKTLLRIGQDTADIPAPTATDPEQMLAAKRRREILRQALGRLPANQHTAFVLSQYDGLSYQDIADILKTSLSSVESLIHRARRNLQKSLRNYYEEFERE